MVRFLPGIVLVVVAALAAPAAAQVPIVHYDAGWNMVGGPPGVALSFAEQLYQYHAGAYTPTPGAVTSACAGYWAYAAAPSDVDVPPTGTSTQTCSLQGGWNMVGNPFDQPALLPPGIVGYWWDPSSTQYVPVSIIPTGSAIWLYAKSAQSVPLQPAPQGGITVFAPPPPSQPIHLHVGAYLTLVLPASPAGSAWEPHADPKYFQLIRSGPLPGSQRYYYRWEATTPGDTIIGVDPACLKQGCALPSFAVRVTIIQ